MSSPGRVGRALWMLMATLPPAATLAALLDSARRHPVAAAALALGYEVALLALGVAGKVFGRLQERWIDRAAERSDRLLLRALARYGRVYRYYIRKLHHDVDIRGLSTQGDYALSISDVFVDVNLVATAAHALSGQVLDPARTDGGRQSLWEVIQRGDNNVLAVLGAPGGGKTTLLKHVALQLAGGDPRLPKPVRRMLPILLFLREHAETIVADPEVSVAALVRSTLRRFRDLEPPGWFDARLAAGQCFVMLDGLDEVAQPAHRHAVVRWVEAQIVQYPGNRFVITSRPHGYQTRPLNGADVVRVLPFADEQVERFIRGWYLATETRRAGRRDVGVREQADAKATDLLRRIRANPSLTGLAVNPLLLTMIAHVHSYRGALPGTRVALYREICEVFLGRRDEGKGLTADLKPEQKQIVLQHLAFAMMDRRTRDISTADAAEVLRAPLSSVPGDVAPEAFLRSMEQSSGLIAELAPGIWSFAHLTFQEYLASVHILETHHPDVLRRNVTASWWREVTLLYVAQTDADVIVRACLAATEHRVAALALAADCIDGARQTSPSLRVEVEQALSSEGNLDTQRRAEVAEVFLVRRERRVYRAPRGTRLFADPVSEIEWNLCSPLPGATPAARPVLGLSARGAEMFVRWTELLGRPMRLPDADEVVSILRASDWPTGVRCVWASGRDGRIGLAHAMDPIPAATWNAFVLSTLSADYDSLIAADLDKELHWLRSSILQLHPSSATALRMTLPATFTPVPNLASVDRVPLTGLRIANALDLDGLYRSLRDAYTKDLPGTDPDTASFVARLGDLICLLTEVVLGPRGEAPPAWTRARLRAMLWTAAEFVRPMLGRGDPLVNVRTRHMLGAATRGLTELTLWEQRLLGLLPATEGLLLADAGTAPVWVPAQHRRHERVDVTAETVSG